MNDQPLELGLRESSTVSAEGLYLFLQAAPLTELVLNVNLKYIIKLISVVMCTMLEQGFWLEPEQEQKFLTGTGSGSYSYFTVI